MILGTIAVVLALIVILAFVAIAVLATVGVGMGVGTPRYNRLVGWGGALIVIALIAGAWLVIDGLVALVLWFGGVTL